MKSHHHSANGPPPFGKGGILKSNCRFYVAYIQRKHNKNLTHTARMLRKNLTPQEKELWYKFLNKLPIRFLRQKVIDRFIADFYCSSLKLIIEIDGYSHYTPSGAISDKERTKIIEQYGFKVIRFSNAEIDNNFEAVCKKIDKDIKRRQIELTG